MSPKMGKPASPADESDCRRQNNIRQSNSFTSLAVAELTTLLSATVGYGSYSNLASSATGPIQKESACGIPSADSERCDSCNAATRFECLWIDAICIIQDSNEDKKEELPAMSGANHWCRQK